ncbi:DUF6790 family protein [Mycolicibacterium palauense]|uniref:DUF6790 family protein n=1 Tax=Mycolicibacterium palauense TaxID=2034511 RepID=UPI000BFEEA74|nr:DUF6790 family protein [Mycolicibacterium palauense]
MNVLIAVLVALIGGFVQAHRSRDRPAVDAHLVWWMVVVVGVGSIVGALYHIFDGAQTAELIGYTRGDGGFQWENAMGDLGVGVLGIMGYWYRGHFWLATIVMLTVQYIGDAAGHIYFWAAQGNTSPYNIGVPLWSDIGLPIVMWLLYLASRRRGGDAAAPLRRADSAVRP